MNAAQAQYGNFVANLPHTGRDMSVAVVIGVVLLMFGLVPVVTYRRFK